MTDWWTELVCPSCRQHPVVGEEGLRCSSCEEVYPVIDGIPIMLPKAMRDQENDFDAFYGEGDYEHNPYNHTPEVLEWRRKPMFTTIVEQLELTPNCRLLDDGGGFGYLQRFLPDNLEYYNFDFSLKMLRKDSSSRRCRGISERLPFPENSFDRVASHHVLEHVDNQAAYLREVFRVLRPGGRFVVNTPRAQWYGDLLWSRFWWLTIIDDNPEWIARNILYLGKHLSPRFVQDAWERRKRARMRPHSMRDIAVDEQWLERTLSETGFRIAYKTRTDNRPHGLTSPFWRRFADRHIDAHVHGFCILIAAVKPAN